MNQDDVFVQGIDAAVGDYEDSVSPYFEGYKPEFIAGYKYGQGLIKRILDVAYQHG